MRNFEEINWKDPSEKISEHFTVKDALWLNKWGRLANEADGLNISVKCSILESARWMEEIRSILGDKPIFVKSWYRPLVYNKEIGGAGKSMHMEGKAVDFWMDINGDGEKNGEDCDRIKEILKGWLVKLDLRLEDNGRGAKWAHADSKICAGGQSRFFRP